MEIPGIGSNNLRLDPNRLVNSPDVLPNKVPPQVKEQGEAVKNKVPSPQTLPNQAPDTPVLTKNTQTFSNLLMEIGVPHTPQNNQLAQTLASYGQPVNKQTMNQVNNALGPLMNQGVANVEAGVVLMINNIPVTPHSVESVKQLLTGGGLSQNLLVLNKELKKMVDNFGNKDFITEVSDKINQKALINSPVDATENHGEAKLLGQGPEKTDNLKLPPNPLKQQEGKVDSSTQVKKNPYQEEEQNEEMPKVFRQQHVESSKTVNTSLIRVEGNEQIQNLNPNQVISQLATRAEKLNQTLNNLLTIDVLKNPSLFPHQISMLKKSFADLEVDIKEFKEIIEKNFPEIKQASSIDSQDENIFTNLLKMVFGDNQNDKVKKLKDNNPGKEAMSFDSDLFKNLDEIADSISKNISGREILTKNLDCMCIPLSIPVNGKFYDVEIMIRREDQSKRKAEVGNVPLKIQLAIETKNMGKVGADISNLKRDLQIHLNVENHAIKEKVQYQANKLQEALKVLPYDLKPIICSVNPKPDQSPSILLPQKYKVMSMNRIEGIV